VCGQLTRDDTARGNALADHGRYVGMILNGADLRVRITTGGSHLHHLIIGNNNSRWLTSGQPQCDSQQQTAAGCHAGISQADPASSPP
jgi:hypothetical protein